MLHLLTVCLFVVVMIRCSTSASGVTSITSSVEWLIDVTPVNGLFVCHYDDQVINQCL